MSPFLPILAIDTAAQQCAVAVLGDGLALDRIERQAQGQSQRLLPLIQELLAEAGLAMPDLKAVAVTTGPGSFTGLRIGLAAAHGIALALSIPAIGIDSFTAFRGSIEDERDSVVIIESRRKELYWQAAGPAFCTAPEEIEAMIKDKPAARLIGDGCQHLRDLLPGYELIDQSPGPAPLAIARLGLAGLAREVPQTLPQAHYIRPPDAKPSAA